MPTAKKLIDTAAHLRHRDRAARGYHAHNFLKQRVAHDMVARLDGINREFATVADIGCHDGTLTRLLAAHGRIGKVVGCDTSAAMIARAKAHGDNDSDNDSGNMEFITADCAALPFAEASLDGIFSALSLHWAEDLPAAIARLARLLKPDGLFMVALYGGGTLAGLRAALAAAESETLGGMSPRILPCGEIRALGGLLSRAGLALPVADSDSVRITWPDIFAMMGELRGMGEASALAGRRRAFTPRKVFTRAGAIMQDETAPDTIADTFEIITLTAWAPHASQQQPMRPGSAKTRLAHALDSVEDN